MKVLTLSTKPVDNFVDKLADKTEKGLWQARLAYTAQKLGNNNILINQLVA